MDQNLIIVIVLILLAVLGLMVGVANDAVNFLSSAIGSKTAKFRTIMIIAAIGVLVGVTFSSGMMEVARKGIFHPDMFTMPELLVIFVSVLLTNVILLDFFNTFSLPTSTTVSIIFELLGAAIAVSIIKIAAAGDDIATLFSYINTSKAFLIVGGIFLSIVFAFVLGSITQFISRLIFTFEYEKKLRRYGALWGSLALTIITFFLVLKGAKSASFMTKELSEYIKSNMDMIFVFSFIGWAIILQLLVSFTKINILKIIVLAGTFALAMAFAANDLVNFIGAPLAALNSYQIAMETANPETTSMLAMTEPVKANTLILLTAGLVMVITLFMSKKAKSVTETTISLGRQDEGYERFETNAFARSIVRGVLMIFDWIQRVTPESIKKKVNTRFDLTNYNKDLKKGEKPAFDLLRAAVILMVSSAIISYATYLKLPLSTTYVTFMVAMAAAMPDRSWGRESAVSRVSGVITVISGWFFTAIIAATTAMFIAGIIYYGEIYAVILLLIFAVFLLFRNTRIHKEREKDHKELEKSIRILTGPAKEQFKNIMTDFAEHINAVSELTSQGLKFSIKQKRKKLKKTRKASSKLSKTFGNLHKDILNMSRETPEDYLLAGHFFTGTLSSVNNIADSLSNLLNLNYSYVDDNFEPFSESQSVELTELGKINSQVITFVSKLIANEGNPQLQHELDNQIYEFNEKIKELNINELSRVRESGSNYKRSKLYFSNLSNMEIIVDNIMTVKHICKDLNDAMDGNTAVLDQFKPAKFGA